MAKRHVRQPKPRRLRGVAGQLPPSPTSLPLERYISKFTRKAQRLPRNSPMRKLAQGFKRDSRGLRVALAFLSDMNAKYIKIRAGMSPLDRAVYRAREEMQRTLDRELLTRFFAARNPRTLERYLNVARTLAESVGDMQRTVDDLLRDYEQGKLRQLSFKDRSLIERALNQGLVKKIRAEFRDFFTEASLIVRAAKDKDLRFLARIELKHRALRETRQSRGHTFYDNPNNWLQVLALSHMAEGFTQAEQRGMDNILGALPAYCKAKVEQSLGRDGLRFFFDLRKAFWEFATLR